MSRKNEDLWDILRKHLRMKQLDAPKRFLLDRVKRACTQLMWDEKRRVCVFYRHLNIIILGGKLNIIRIETNKV